MRKGVISDLVEKYKVQAGGNEMVAGNLAADYISTLFEQKKITPNEISIKALFEELVDPEGHLDMHSSTQEIAEAVSTSNFATITNTVMNAAVIPAYEVAVGNAGKIVTELNAVKTGPEDIAGYTAATGFEVRHEGMSYTETSFGEKYWTIDKHDFGEIISLTREAIFDDRTGQLIRRAQIVGEKGGQLRGKIITKTLEVNARTEQGESTSRAAVYGGSAISMANFYNADHSALIDSAGTNRTLVTSNGITVDGCLQNAAVYFTDMLDERGDEVVVIPDSLIYHPQIAQTVWELVKTNVKRGVNNDIENYNFGRYDLVELPFLSTGTTWYIGSPQKQLVWLWVWKPATQVQRENSELAFQAQIVLRYRFNWNGGCGHTDYRYLIKNTA